jgi:DNA-binding response OmpR family regulator
MVAARTRVMATPVGTDSVTEGGAARPITSISPRRILLAEDDRELRDMLANVLAHDGHQVVAVPDGRELLKVLARPGLDSVFDLIVSDDRMPGWTGMQILSGMRSLEDRPPLILITAFADEPLRARATMLGAAAVLDKPFDFDDFRAVVSNLLTPRGT